MDLYVVRHAVAYKRDPERWPDDSERPLTRIGEESFRRTAAALSNLVPEVGTLLSSPYARTWRTAELLEEAGWPAPVSSEELEPGHPPYKAVGALADVCGARYDGIEPVAIVGHRPQLHELVSYLLTGDANGARIQIKKGGVVRLQFDGPPEPGNGSLRWLLTPKALLRAAG